VIAPFATPIADPWSATFHDVETLNAAASDAVREQVEQVRTAARQGEVIRSSSLLLLGPAGAGKTHLFGRLRRQLGARAVLIHLRPDLAAGLTPRSLLSGMMDSLQRPPIGAARSQLELMVGALLGAVDTGRSRFPNVSLAEYAALPTEARTERMEEVLAHLEAAAPDLARSSEYLLRLLDLPFLKLADRRAALAWLSGWEPAESQLARLGLHGPLADEALLPAIRSLSAVAALGTPIVLFLDQLENLVSDTDAGHLGDYARLVSELVETVRGLVLVQLAIDTEWLGRIRPALGTSERARLEARVLTLGLPSPTDRERLIRTFLEALEPPPAGPFPAPLSPEDVARWCAQSGLTPRMLIAEMQEAFARQAEASPGAAPEPAPPLADLDDRLEELHAAELARTRSWLDAIAREGQAVPASRLLGGLLTALPLLGMPVESAPTRRDPDRLTVTAGGARATVIVLQATHPTSVAAALRQAAAQAAAGPVHVLRDAALPYRPGWVATAKLHDALRATPGAAFHWVPRADLAALLAAEAFAAAARSHDLSTASGQAIPPDAARAWLQRHLRAAPPVTCEAVRQGPAASAGSASPEAVSVPRPAQEARAPEENLVLRVLSRLHLASVQRLHRETAALVPGIPPERVRAEIDAAVSAGDVTLFGQHLVARKEVDR
jgi:hypothetical protein